jgi:hypothetical protein
MNTVRATTAVYLWLLVVISPATADTKVDPREKLDTAVPEAIRLLEAKDYSTFLKNFIPPDELKKVTEKATLDEFANKFGENKATRLLQVLKSIRDAKPTLDPSEKKATYELKEPIDRKKTLTWVKVDKHWYIQN